MIGNAKLAAAMLGTGTIANGFAVTPTGPASLQVLVAPGEVYSLTSIDALAFSTLPADTTHSIMKQGILLDGVTLSCPAPGTTGQSINYLVQVTYQDSDSTPALLPYYNSANPALPYSGMGNNGLTQNTSRKGIAVVAVKPGASAATGSQVTPAPDAGYIGLYVVTVAFGQTTITGGSISQYSGAPLLPAGLIQAMQKSQTTSANDIGVANAYAANFTPAITTLTDKMCVCIKAGNANTTASTFTPAPGVITPAPIIGSGHGALQGGEIVATGDVWLQWNSSIGSGSWILLNSTGGGAEASATDAAAGTNNTKWMSPLRTAQAISALVLQATTVVSGKSRFGTIPEQQAGTLSTVMSNPIGVATMLTDFLPKRTFTASDYIRIPDVPGGLIIQIGTAVVSTTTTGGTTVVSLPTTFPNTHLGGMCIKSGIAPTNDALVAYYNATSMSTATLVLDAATGSGTPTGNQTVYYISLGN